MSKRIHILGSACNIVGGLIGVPGWLLRSARLMLVPKSERLVDASFMKGEVKAPPISPS